MNKNWSRFLALAIAVAVVLSVFLLIPPGKRRNQPPPESAPVSQIRVDTNLPVTSQLAEADLNNFTNRFEKHFKPEITRWCKVYEGRLPFRESDVTIDKFHSKVGGFLYTFMIGDTTFTMYDGPQGTHVFYMMTRQAAQQLNSVPNGAVQHDISMPVSRQVITGLLKADAGYDYPADQISIHPTGISGSMQGGVMVEAGGITGNNVFRVMTATNLDFVLDGNGTLVSYQH
jgi:hypothetical protein